MEQNRKIINDPVFGFISIPSGFIYQILSHPYMQRLNRIKQLGLASLVYPGAQHSRLHHSLGAMHLMDEAIKQLRLKGQHISKEEEEAALACILMHDIGHGPFSHSLESTIMPGLTHEEISLLLMQEMNKSLNGRLDTCIRIFKNEYPKKFLHQLVSGQLDMDRLDYLRRDSFFTGVTEGNIGSARIIKMLNVHQDKLVIEAKGIYSIETFLMARRLMYWQVYLHKTCIAAEKMLLNIFRRAKELAAEKKILFASPALHHFLYLQTGELDMRSNKIALNHFIDIDDNDIWSAIKVWKNNPDKILSILSTAFINRDLFKIEISSQPFLETKKEEIKKNIVEHLAISKSEADYFFYSDEISTNMYNEADDNISIMYKNGQVVDISEASDMFNIELLSKKIKKYYHCFLRYSK